jgi:hypothetical protein
MSLKITIKITAFCLLLSLSFADISIAQAKEIESSALSPSISILNQSIKLSIEQSAKSTIASPFMQRRPANWEKRLIPRQWLKRKYSLAQYPLEALAEELMVYPQNLLNRPDMFDHLDQTDPGIAFDMEHYEFNYDTGYWHSKDLPDLVLGAWQDIERKFPKNTYGHLRSKMARHVVVRYKRPDAKGTISFYYFDNHAFSVPYALEAEQRGELSSSDLTHIIVDQHSDSLKALDFNIPNALAEWNKLVESDYVSMNSFHSVFAGLGFFKRLIWVFDKYADSPTSRENSTKQLRSIARSKSVKSISMQDYNTADSRPKRAQALVNIDVDATDQMLGIKEESDIADYPRIAGPEEALLFYTDFLLQLIKKDFVNVLSFQASTTNWFRRDDGDVETVRFLARTAPIIILNNKTASYKELQLIINKIIDNHKNNLTVSEKLKAKIQTISVSNKKDVLKISSDAYLINRAI